VTVESRDQRELEELRRELAELLYAVSHDVRAPVRVIDGFSEALAEDFGESLPAEAREYATTIREAVVRLDRLFEGVLRLGRVSQAPLQRTTVDVSALANTIASELHAAEPGRDVRFAIEAGLAVDADPALFQLALEQLLGNAWKFTAKASSASIAVGREDATTLFVRDDGPGFDPAHAQRLFGPFQRLHGDAYDGLGIGLALVRRIVHRHGGSVRAVGALQQGMTVYLEFP
jgi:signal transduction histidine kinase